MAMVVYDLHNLFRYEMQLIVCQEPLSSDSLNFLQEEEALCKYGLTLYTLDRLYKAVELHAKKTTEWSRSVSAHFFFLLPLIIVDGRWTNSFRSHCSVRQKMFKLAKPNVGVSDKLDVLQGLKWNYACLRPYLS
jgi:nuclear-control-of-ATPase protein 2